MKKVLIFLMIALIVLPSCVACRYKYTEQDIVVEGWLQKSMSFNLGRFESHINPHRVERKVVFYVKDERAFTDSILKHEKLLRQEYNVKNNEVYVFLDSGNYYLLISNGGKPTEYILRPALSVFVVAGGVQYLFPLFDCTAYYDGTIYFVEDPKYDMPTKKTEKSWQDFLDYFDKLSDEYFIVDENERSATIKVTENDRGINRLISDKRIKILYLTDETGNYLKASMIDLTLP